MPFQLATVTPETPAMSAIDQSGQPGVLKASAAIVAAEARQRTASVETAEPTRSARKPRRIRPGTPVACITAKSAPAVTSDVPSSVTAKVTKKANSTPWATAKQKAAAVSGGSAGETARALIGAERFDQDKKARQERRCPASRSRSTAARTG